MFLSDVSIKRPVFATMMMVALLVFGLVSYTRLAIDEYPDITYPTISVNTAYPGASPEVMEREVSRPIEEALNTVQGIREVTSTSREGNSSVRVNMQLGVNVMEAQQDVISKVARIRRQLPPEVQDPVIIRFDPNDRPIMSISIQSTDRSIRDLTDLADQVIANRLESIPGVGGINVNGGTPREIRVGEARPRHWPHSRPDGVPRCRRRHAPERARARARPRYRRRRFCRTTLGRVPWHAGAG